MINAIKFSIEEIEASDQYFDHTGSIDTVGTTARERSGNDGRQMQAVGMRLRHKVYGWRDSAWSKKPTALARLTMVVVGQGMLMARPILVDVNLRRLKMVVSEAMRCGRVVTKRNSGGGANDAQRIQDNEQTRCLLPLPIGQKTSHLLYRAATAHPNPL